MTWKALDQDEWWWHTDQATGDSVRKDLIELDPEHLYHLRAWLERKAFDYAPEGCVDPTGWMRERPLYKRVDLLIEHPGQVGELIAGMLTEADLKTIKRELNARLEVTADGARKVAIKRVLWKVGAVLRSKQRADQEAV